MLNSSVLVLNRSYLPIHVTSVRRAFTLLFQDVARALDESYQTFDFPAWSRLSVEGCEAVGTSAGEIRVPRVIALLHFDRVPMRHVRYSRMNVFARDGYTCQYCGRQPGRKGLTIDHVVPRSQSGPKSWENLVTACMPCNRKKGGRRPEEASMRLMAPPVMPRYIAVAFIANGARHSAWEKYFHESGLVLPPTEAETEGAGQPE